MIKKLQIKFIIIAMSASIIVTFAIFGIIMMVNYRTIDKQNEGILNLIIENGGYMPEYKKRDDFLSNVITKETQFSTRYFFIKLDNDGEIAETNMKYIASISPEQAGEIISKIRNEDKEEGYYEDFKYKTKQEDDGKIVVFLDCHTQLNNLRNMTEKGIGIILFGLTIIFIIIFVLSKRALKPIIENIESQKQFITNAGHELKTPVAVIMANMDIMEMTPGENQEWINSSKNQAKRLNTLIRSMLNLSNIEERNLKLNFTDFSITKIIKEEISEFKALAQNKKIEYDDSKDIIINADYDTISQLVIIFLDNAIKYTPDNGTIKVITEKIGKNIKIQFLNDCEDVKTIDTKKLFDRFYREDKARTPKKEGYGIGLSIAKSIVNLHNGKLTAEINKDNMICFTIII